MKHHPIICRIAMGLIMFGAITLGFMAVAVGMNILIPGGHAIPGDEVGPAYGTAIAGFLSLFFGIVIRLGMAYTSRHRI
jgi:hypothetical protein